MKKNHLEKIGSKVGSTLTRRTKVANKIATLKSTLKENEVLDETTLHKFVESPDGEIVEMKYCHICNEWHPLSDFYVDNSKVDGLNYICKTCVGRSYKKKTTLGVRRSSRAVKIPSNIQLSIPDQKPDHNNGGLDSILDSIREEYEKGQREIEELKKKVKELSANTKDLTRLTNSEVEYVVKNYDVTPRLLFDAIRRQTSQYEFYAIDTVSGCKIPRKFDNNVVGKKVCMS